MSNLLESLMTNYGGQLIQGMTKILGTKNSQTQSALASAMPILLNALSRNISKSKGASSLEGAIDRDHDGSILDNLGDFFNKPEVANGGGILKHVLGKKRGNIEKYISEDSGISLGSAGKLLEMVAPVIMGMLGREKKQQSRSSGGSIIDLLKRTSDSMAKEAPQNQSVIEQLLDKDNDGTIVDDVAELGMSFLGKLFRK